MKNSSGQQYKFFVLTIEVSSFISDEFEKYLKKEFDGINHELYDESVNTALSTSGYLFNGDGGPTS